MEHQYASYYWYVPGLRLITIPHAREHTLTTLDTNQLDCREICTYERFGYTTTVRNRIDRFAQQLDDMPRYIFYFLSSFPYGLTYLYSLFLQAETLKYQYLLFDDNEWPGY